MTEPQLFLSVLWFHRVSNTQALLILHFGESHTLTLMHFDIWTVGGGAADRDPWQRCPLSYRCCLSEDVVTFDLLISIRPTLSSCSLFCCCCDAWESIFELWLTISPPTGLLSSILPMDSTDQRQTWCRPPPWVWACAPCWPAPRWSSVQVRHSEVLTDQLNDTKMLCHYYGCTTATLSTVNPPIPLDQFQIYHINENHQ